MTKRRITIGYCWHWYTFGSFAKRLADTVIALTRAGWHVSIEEASSTHVAINRNVIIGKAVKDHRATEVFFVDDDMRFTPEDVQHVLTTGADLPILGVACAGRTKRPGEQTGPVRSNVWDGQHWLTRAECLALREAGAVRQFAAVGSAFTLYRVDALMALREPEPHAGAGGIFVGTNSDVRLCEKAYQRGVPVWVDFTRDVRHIGNRDWGLDDIEA